MNFLKKWDDAMKCLRVINSCITLEQLFVAHNMIDNFGKKYKFDRVWGNLNALVSQKEFKKMDELKIGCVVSNNVYEWSVEDLS